MGSHGMRERTEHRAAIEAAVGNAADALDLDLTPEQVRPLAVLVDAELRHDGWRLDVLRPAVDQKAAPADEGVHLQAMAAERTILADAYDGMSDVARRLLGGWIPMRRADGDMAWRKRSWNPPKWEDMASAEYEALLNLMGLDWEPGDDA